MGRTTANYIKKRMAEIGSSSADYVKKAPGSTANYIKEASGVRKGNAGSYVDAAPRLVGNMAADATVGAVKGANKVMPFTSKTKQNIGNFYTGRTEGPGMIAGAAVLGVGYSAFQTEKQTTFSHKLGQSSYVGAAPALNSDGVGQVSNAPTLGASGGTVFGLHNARKG